MQTFSDRLNRLLHRVPFAVLGYSAEDETWCPTCLRLATGLSPGRTDYDGMPIKALYAADPTLHEEICCNCHEKLTDLTPALQPPTTLTVVCRSRVPDSTVVRVEPVGVALLDANGKGGALYLNFLEEPCYLAVAEEEAKPDHGPVEPKAPTIRKRH